MSRIKNLANFVEVSIKKDEDLKKWKDKSIKWFSNQMDQVATNVAKGIAQPSPSIELGGMYNYFYDPKTKDKLPYWDEFPLMIPIRISRKGFLGLNLHYLPLEERIQFLDALMDFEVQDNIRMKYDMLKNINRLRAFKPCLKQYLWSHVQSVFYEVPVDKWQFAIFLPTARFKNDSKSNIYRDSIDKIDR